MSAHVATMRRLIKSFCIAALPAIVLAVSFAELHITKVVDKASPILQ
jgi:hypothetical protein